MALEKPLNKTLLRRKLCGCGCGTVLKPNRRFVWGHYIRTDPPLRRPGLLNKVLEKRIGYKHSLETKNKISETKKGKKWTEEFRAKMMEINKKPEVRAKRRESQLGKKLSEEHKRKISLGLIGKMVGDKNPARKPGVGKKISEALKGRKQTPEFIEKRIAPIRGRKATPFTKEHCKNISRSAMGRIPWNKGKTGYFSKEVIVALIARKTGSCLSQETKNKISKASKERWADPEYREKTVRSIIIGAGMKPNKPEKKLNNILQKLFPKEYKLNVKANVMTLGGKVPDFVNVNGKKKLIEFFGDYWHKNDNPNKRINYFKQFGWDTLELYGKKN